MNIQNRRLHERKALKVKVVFEDEKGEGVFYVYSKDISLGGILLSSSIPVKIGTFLLISFELPIYKRPVRVTGEVVRVGDGGVGVRFVGLKKSVFKQLWVAICR